MRIRITQKIHLWLGLMTLQILISAIGTKVSRMGSTITEKLKPALLLDEPMVKQDQAGTTFSAQSRRNLFANTALISKSRSRHRSQQCRLQPRMQGAETFCVPITAMVSAAGALKRRSANLEQPRYR